jgi:hypothetical protein
MRKLICSCAFALGLTVGLSACTDPYDPGQRAIGGGLFGAGTGAAVGGIAGGGRGAATGALIGGTLGALGGAATTPSYGYYGDGYSGYGSSGAGYNRYDCTGLGMPFGPQPRRPAKRRADADPKPTGRGPRRCSRRHGPRHTIAQIPRIGAGTSSPNDMLRHQLRPSAIFCKSFTSPNLLGRKPL